MSGLKLLPRTFCFFAARVENFAPRVERASLTIRRKAAQLCAPIVRAEAAQAALLHATQGALIMMRMLSGRRRGVLLTTAVLLSAIAGSANAASIWERAGPFQACLEGRFEKWVNARAEFVVNEDASAGDIDDADVAQWTVAALDACRAQAGSGDQDSEARFTKHLAHWREHIYRLVQSIRERTRPD